MLLSRKGAIDLTNGSESASVPLTSPHEERARKFYEALAALSTEEEVAGAKRLVFRGYITEAFRTTGLPQSQYNPCKALLEYNQCIEVVERAWRHTVGMVVLHGLPDGMLSVPPRSKKDLTLDEEYSRLQDRVKRLEELVGGLHLPTVLAELAQRLDGKDGSDHA